MLIQERMMHFPTWVDLKGQDAVPETVHHVVCHVDPNSDTSWQSLPRKVKVRERKGGVQRERKMQLIKWDKLRVLISDWRCSFQSWSEAEQPLSRYILTYMQNQWFFVLKYYFTRIFSFFPSLITYINHVEGLSEAVKLLKADYLVKAINAHKMDQAIVFCRTKLDCDNIENYLQSLGGGQDTLRILSVYSQYTIIIVGPKSMVNEYSCVCLHGDRRPQERKDNLQKFKV